MKNNTAFKITTWSAVGIIFTIIFLMISFVEDFSFSIFYDDTDLKSINKVEWNIDNIDNINIDWIYGSLYVSSYEGDKIIIDERSSKDNKDGLLNIKQDGNTLNLTQKKGGTFYFFNFGFNRIATYIKMPVKQYAILKAKIISGKFEATGIKADLIDLKLTSGKGELNGITSDLKVNMTSGHIDISGLFNKIDANATSGYIKIESDTAPDDLKVNLTSGSAVISLPENDGFIVGVSKTSGSFRSDFDLDEFNIYKNGTRKYNVKMTSGMVKLERN